MYSDSLTTSQAAKVFRVTRFTVLNWIKQGKLSAIVTPGGHHRIPKKAILETFSTAQQTRKKAAIESSQQKRRDLPVHNVNIADLLKKSLFASGKYIASIRKKRGGG